jgi:TPR repeat protein
MDIAKGRHLLEEAATLGSTDAQYVLGKAYIEGLWVERDLTKARMWLKMAANGGHADAAVYLKWLDLPPPSTNPTSGQ